MVKSELVKRIAEETGYTLKNVQEILAKGEEIIKEKVTQEKEEVKINGFLTLKAQFKPSRQVRNPKTGEKMMSKEHYAVKVKAIGAWF